MAQARNGILAALATLSLLVICLIPAAMNRSPIIYPDSVGYYQSGRAALVWAHLLPKIPKASHSPLRQQGSAKAIAAENDDGISTARSVYYGAILALAFAACGIWAVAVIQALVCITATWLAVRHLARDASAKVRVAIVAATIGLGGASAFSDAIMPDLFAGLLILALTIFIVYRERLTKGEKLWWIALALAAILFHKSHLALALAVLIVGSVLNFATKRNWRRGLMIVFGLIVLGAAGHAAVDVTVRKVLHKGPTSPPFILARMIGDGTAEAYLREACPHERYETCAILSRMPMTENQFLWSKEAGGFAALSAPGRQRIIAEETAIALGTLEHHAGKQILVSTGNVIRQLSLVGVREYSLAPGAAPASAPGLEHTLERYQARTKATRLALMQPLSVLMAISYFLSLGFLLCLLLTPRPRNPGAVELGDMPSVTWLLLGGIVANAAICGAISGVFDRYQGRVSWLATLLALCWLYASWRASPAPPGGRNEANPNAQLG